MPNRRDLNRRLAELFSTADSARMIVGFTTLPLLKMDFSGSPMVMWSKILMEADKHPEGIKDIVEMAQGEYPEDKILVEAIKKETKVILTEKQNILTRLRDAYKVDKEKLKALVAKDKLKDVLQKLDFISETLTDDFQHAIINQKGILTQTEGDYHGGILTKEEYGVARARIRKALLFYIDRIEDEEETIDILNDLNRVAIKEEDVPLNVDTDAFEKIMGSRNDLMEINWLQKAMEASKSICKVQLANGGMGSGWIYKSQYLITNNHVIKTPADAKGARAIFNYQLSSGGNVQEFILDPDTFFITSDESLLDYTCVAIVANDELSQFGSLQVNTSNLFKKGDLVNIIQHPLGGTKKIAMPDEILSTWSEKNYLFYMADTQPGSSGSPVFNQNWEVIGIHHAGKGLDGFIINQEGDKKPSNRGIYISAIINEINTQLS